MKTYSKRNLQFENSFPNYPNLGSVHTFQPEKRTKEALIKIQKDKKRGLISGNSTADNKSDTILQH